MCFCFVWNHWVFGDSELKIVNCKLSVHYFPLENWNEWKRHCIKPNKKKLKMSASTVYLPPSFKLVLHYHTAPHTELDGNKLNNKNEKNTPNSLLEN